MFVSTTSTDDKGNLVWVALIENIANIPDSFYNSFNQNDHFNIFL